MVLGHCEGLLLWQALLVHEKQLFQQAECPQGDLN